MNDSETLYDRVRGLPAAMLHDICRLAGGACYLVDAGMVGRNVGRLLGAMRREYARSQVAYSYKTNYHEVFVRAARRAGALSEVVSATEYEYAVRLGVPDEEVVFNGPGKSRDLLRELLARKVTVIADSLGELARMEALRAEGVEVLARVGVRVNPAMSFQKTESRFGVDFRCRDQREALRRLIGEGFPLRGIHLHLTDDRSLPAFLERIDHLLESWYLISGEAPEFLDCGGGFASGMPDSVRSQLGYDVASLEEYGLGIGRKLADLFPSGEVEFLCEPGTGILADAGVIVTPVMDVKTCGGRSLAVVDGTYFTINPLRSAARPLCALIPAEDRIATVPPPVGIYGNSCMDIDRIVDGFGSEVGEGDILIIGQKGAYASCMATPFIQGIPALIALEEAGFRIVRARAGAGLIDQLNSSGSSESTDGQV